VARLITGLTAERVAANLERVHGEIDAAARRAGRDPAGVSLLAAVKYVPLEALGVLVEAGIGIVGENRAQDLEAKATGPHGPALRWHFIGQLQSRKVRQIVPHAELIHSLGSASALEQLHRHATEATRVLVQVNVAGDDAKAGVEPAELGAFLERAAARSRVAGLMTMRPFAQDPRPAGRTSPRCASSPRPPAAPPLHGDLAGLRGAVEEGRRSCARLGTLR
jgi:uncharacterized pyridoxal phosphate-containing UPF0001 family protein